MTDSTLGAMQHRVRNLTLWHGHVEPEPLPGGLSNQNFMVRDGADGYVVRLVGGDDPAHGIVREREVAVSRAAHRAGIAPELVHVEPGILVFRFVAGRVLTEREVRGPAMLDRIAELLRRCHRDVAAHLRGPAPCFWVFHALRDYLAQLDSQGVLVGRTERLRGIAGALERVVGPIDLALTHNDLMPGNIIDDGDLASLVVDNELDAAAQAALLAAYFSREPSSGLLHRFAAMVLAAELREALWARVQEIHSRLAFDYAGYAAAHETRFERGYAMFSAGA